MIQFDSIRYVVDDGDTRRDAIIDMTTIRISGSNSSGGVGDGGGGGEEGD